MGRWVIFVMILLTVTKSSAQTSFQKENSLSFSKINFQAASNYSTSQKQFLSTTDFLDAAINSLNSFNSLLKKEAYRIKITSFNNPTSSDMGFNLENEIQTALKPLLEKAKNTNTQKFSGIVSSILGSQSNSGLGKTLSLVSPVFPTLLGLVGNLTVQEKKITREDLDSFINATSKYFVQYEKLNQANNLLDQNIDRLNARMRDLQFDMKEYLLDISVILYKDIQRNTIKSLSNEELFLKYLDRLKLQEILDNRETEFRYPADGIKGAKELANNLQKLFNDYQKVYTENYTQIKTILQEAKKLGKNINLQQVDYSLKEVEGLYNESKSSDILSLRLTTLFERLKVLVASEQVAKQ
jgi:F0F1-type ATP synthase membrane subunit b/b'